MASVSKSEKSQYWQANIRAFDAHRGWVRRALSTRIPLAEPKARAQLIADQLEAAAAEMASLFETQQEPDKDYFDGVVAELAALAGAGNHTRIQTERRWKPWREYWLAETPCAASTQRGKEQALKKLEEFLGKDDFPLSLLTRQRMQQFFDWLCVQGMTAATITVRWHSVRACLSRAKALGVLESNPTDAVLVRGRLPTDDFERQPFTPEEIARIFRTVPPEWKTACLFGYVYGLRIGDATHRSWSEIKDGVLIFLSEKKRSRLQLPLVPILEQHLATLRQTSEWITPTLATMNRSNLSKRFRQLLDAAEVRTLWTPRAARGQHRYSKSFHSWRHTNKSMLRALGVSPRVSNLINDHESEEIARRYDHVAIEECREALLRLPSVTDLAAKPQEASAANRKVISFPSAPSRSPGCPGHSR